MSRVRTLLVDDAVDLRVMIRRALEASGRYVVVGEAGDGVEAIAQAAELSPELVLLDLSMPRMDGLEALPRLHAVSPGSAVVILSGHTRELAESAALAAGAIAYLEKGLRPTQLIEALDTARGVPARTADDDAVARPPIEPPDTATLLSELAHDLRGQIAKTSGFLALVRHQLEEDHDAVPAADRARDAVDRLERLLDGAMAYTRAGAESLALRVVRVGDALGDVLSDLGDGGRFHVCLREDAEVLADRIALDRVLRNVTGNALRYSEGGEVSLVVTTEGDRGRIDVLDRGPGFTEADLESLFRPFGRGSAGTDRGGSGLGLPVAARLVQAMGGDMSAGRRSGGGARVTVHLPLAPRP
ncbi:MAG: response regulator [Actinobacteria bacterium]|nr:response regulator [Actinomycetota bacterium]